MTAIFRYSKMNHPFSFQITRPVNHEIVVKIERDCSFSYEVNNSEEFDSYSMTLVPLLVPAGLKPPYFSTSVVHHFYLRGARVVMVQENSKLNCTTFTELVERSEQLHREDFPPLSRETRV